MGLPLPGELVVLAFENLDIPSLLRCMQVCKIFHSIISGSTLLCYKIMLFASYMDDNRLSLMDVATRLDLLREYNRVWNYMDWPSSGKIPMTEGCWEFIGGILAQITNENEIHFVQLPCKLKGIAEIKWSALFDFRIRDFTFDNSQDLVVLIEQAGNFPHILCKVHLRTFSGKHHPRAAVPQITYELEGLQGEHIYLLQICGDRLALLFDPLNSSSQKVFIVWDWRTGRQEVHIRMPNFRSFAFMTEDLILTGIVTTDLEPSLRVLSIAACVSPIQSLEDMPYICELQYPESLGSTDFLLIRSEPAPSWRPPPGSGVPFYCSRKDFIFTICVRLNFNQRQESTVLFVPLSALLLEVERSRAIPRRIAWADWGPSESRMVCRRPSDTWVCYTYGMKFVHGSPWDLGQEARIYDFNPYAARKYVKSSTDSTILWRPLGAARAPSARSEVFEENVVTSLPGRVANFKLNLRAAGGTSWDAVMVGEDHIVMVQQSATSEFGYMAM